MNCYTEKFFNKLEEAAFSTCPHDGRDELRSKGEEKIFLRGLKNMGFEEMKTYLDSLFEEAINEDELWKD